MLCMLLLRGCSLCCGLKAMLFMMTSGQVWNHIRAPPFMENDPRSGSVVSSGIALDHVTN